MAREYTQDFIDDALEMLKREGKQYRAVARRLGLPDSTLRGWYNKSMGKTRGGPRKLKEYRPEATNESAEEKIARLERENQKLRRQLASVEEDKVILKKAAAFFAREHE